jgi:Protein of unknown function (DUF4238)
MKGKPRNHHALPRLLLKGFACRVTDEHYVYQFWRGRVPYEANIRNVASERDLYDEEIEARLASKENVFGPVVQRLRLDAATTDDFPVIVDLVTHLVARTRSIRVGFIDAAGKMMDSLERAFTCPEGTKQLERRLETELRAKVSADVLLAPLFARLTQEQREMLFRYGLDRVDVASITARLVRELRQHVDLPGIVRATQMRVLATDEALSRRRAHLSTLVWSVVAAESNSFVLPDIGPIAKAEASSPFDLPIKVSDRPAAVALAISDSRLLVGEREPGAFGFNPEEINTKAAELSQEFFIGSCNTTRERKYQARIGVRASFIDERQMEDWAREALE